MFNETSAEVVIAGLQPCEQIMQRQVISQQCGRVGFHSDLLAQSTPAIYFIDTRNSAELRTNHPILKRLALHQAGSRPVHCVLENFPESGGHRA